MHKADFSSQLCKLIKKSGIRQSQIAGKLGLSSAAVSYFINGKTLPKPEQLNEIMIMIAASPETTSQMQQSLLAARSRSGTTPKSDDKLPQHVFLMRTYRGLSLPQLAVRTGIPQKRLSALEHSTTPATSGVDENQRIYKVLGTEKKSAGKGAARVADNGNFGAPVLWIKDLHKYDPDKESLLSFAHSNFRDFVSRPFSGLDEPVLLLADCNELSIPHTGILQLIAARNCPERFIPMELRRYSDGKFRLWQKESLPEDVEKLSVEFTIPIVEVIFQPVKLEMQN